MKHFYYYMGLACLLGCPLQLSAQEAEKAEASRTHEVNVKLDKTPDGFANHYSAFYYYSGKEILTMRNYLMKTADKVTSLYINPAGGSYAFIDSRKEKNTVMVYRLLEKDWQIGKVGTTKQYKPTAICYSPDARFLYVMGSDSRVHVFSTRKTQEVNSFAINGVGTRLDASANGYFLVASSKEKIQIINLDNQTVRTSIPLHAELCDLAFSSNCKLMAVLTADGSCDIYDTKTFEVTKHYDAMGLARKCFFHPANKYLTVVTGDQRIAFINLFNDQDRQYLDAKEAGVNYLNYSKTVKNDIYLAYNTSKSLVFTPVGFLTPNRQERLKDELNRRMDDWMERMEGESLDDDNGRMNEESRLRQMRLFEADIATGMAGNILSASEIKMGNYDAEMSMLTLDFDNMASIYLTVPLNELETFMDVNDLEFVNTKYGLNEKDEFEIVYTEVINKRTGKTYIFDNTERKSLAFLEADDNFVPFEQLQGAKMEQLLLEEIKNNIMQEAQDQNFISDHTKIDVRTKVINTTDASGKSIYNYDVEVSYTVDEEYSATDDFAPGRFKCEESNAALAMLAIVKKALTGDFSKYMVEGKQVKVQITGMADALPFRRTVAYDGCYGDFDQEPVYKNDELSNITVTEATGISENEQLAYLRAMGVKDYLDRNIPAFGKMRTTFDTYIEVSQNKGGAYRRIGVKLTFVDAL